jgi:hypothetical protein
MSIRTSKSQHRLNAHTNCNICIWTEGGFDVWLRESKESLSLCLWVWFWFKWRRSATVNCTIYILHLQPSFLIFSVEPCTFSPGARRYSYIDFHFHWGKIGFFSWHRVEKSFLLSLPLLTEMKRLKFQSYEPNLLLWSFLFVFWQQAWGEGPDDTNFVEFSCTYVYVICK